MIGDLFVVGGAVLIALMGWITASRFWPGRGWQPTPADNRLTPPIIARGPTRQTHVVGVCGGLALLMVGTNRRGGAWSPARYRDEPGFLRDCVISVGRYRLPGRRR